MCRLSASRPPRSRSLRRWRSLRNNAAGGCLVSGLKVNGYISMTDEWLSLKGAAAILGVHPSTVRAWSDKGLLPTHRTQGGHRRYKRAEVEMWAEKARNPHDIAPETMVQSAVRNVRMRIS